MAAGVFSPEATLRVKLVPAIVIAEPLAMAIVVDRLWRVVSAWLRNISGSRAKTIAFNGVAKRVYSSCA